MKRYRIRFINDKTIEVEGILFFISNDYEGTVPYGNKYIYLNPKCIVSIEEIQDEKIKKEYELKVQWLS